MKAIVKRDRLETRVDNLLYAFPDRFEETDASEVPVPFWNEDQGYPCELGGGGPGLPDGLDGAHEKTPAVPCAGRACLFFALYQ